MNLTEQDRLVVLEALHVLEGALRDDFYRYKREAEGAKRTGEPVHEAIEILQNSVADRLRGVVALRERLLGRPVL